MRATRSDFELTIAGGGVSGLTLAWVLADELPPTTSILIVDKDDDPDYNISFWTERETPFAPIMQHTWRTIAVRHGERRTVCPLSRYRLQAFWRDDFDAFLQEHLRRHPNVEVLDAAVTRLTDRGDHVAVETSRGELRSAWVFDSRSALRTIREDDPELMWMQGLAVEVECAEATFEPDVATLFDFLLDTPALDFMYVLPYSERSALINVALLTGGDTAVNRASCERMIDDYVVARLGCRDYRQTRACYGRIPLASHFPARRRGQRIVPIGVRGGMIKASTSYAFTRILNDAQQLTRALRETGQPYYPPTRAWYYRWSDKSTASVFERAPKLAQELMFCLFTPTSGDLALAFLDERNTLAENRLLFQAIPAQTTRRFLWQLARTVIGGS